MKIAASIVTEGDVASRVFDEVSGTARNVEAPINPEGEAHRRPGGAGTGRGSEGRPAAHLAREGNPEVGTVPPSEGQEAQTTGAPSDFAIAGRTYRWSWQIRTE
jgi:hypothetical protein